MASILTSWKEIGQYLGKGVRTVQRWSAMPASPCGAAKTIRAMLSWPSRKNWTSGPLQHARSREASR